ncbi:hypothetical protein WDL1CHR_03276 [Variovorax sp. WDL1]|nr:hypothetical protein CHC07_00447 [Variovorax sp. B4]PNG61488.1 hypothetical protein CHC06_01389 [Variovorax sp. B2]VTV12491.1 hypothetical protein WDL1CHR_03276 [Variovorax sp. WDL1]
MPMTMSRTAAGRRMAPQPKAKAKELQWAAC